jgi:excisionase family DNA binding protein
VHLVTLDEAGRRLQLNPATVRRRVKAGVWPAYRMGERSWRVDLDEILRRTRAKRPAPIVPTSGAR